MEWNQPMEELRGLLARTLTSINRKSEHWLSAIRS